MTATGPIGGLGKFSTHDPSTARDDGTRGVASRVLHSLVELRRYAAVTTNQESHTMKKLFAVAMLAFAVPAFAAGEAKPADKSAKAKPEEKKADTAATADAGTAAPKK